MIDNISIDRVPKDSLQGGPCRPLRAGFEHPTSEPKKRGNVGSKAVGVGGQRATPGSHVLEASLAGWHRHLTALRAL